MKKTALILCLLAMMPVMNIFAQEKGSGDWKQRMMSEKIAYITVELSLTPSEAEVFWPVYNQYSEKRDQAFRQVGVSFWKLEKALEEGKTDKALSSCLDEYVDALENSRKYEADAADSFRKVLPEIKVVKLFIAEEQFRRRQISKLHRNQAGQ